MEISGICSACGRQGSMFTCTSCGSIVCENCFNIKKSVCKSCERFTKGDIPKTLK